MGHADEVGWGSGSVEKNGDAGARIHVHGGFADPHTHSAYGEAHLSGGEVVSLSVRIRACCNW